MTRGKSEYKRFTRFIFISGKKLLHRRIFKLKFSAIIQKHLKIINFISKIVQGNAKDLRMLRAVPAYFMPYTCCMYVCLLICPTINKADRCV